MTDDRPLCFVKDMSDSRATVRLLTQPSEGLASIGRHDRPGHRLTWNVNLNVVMAVALPNSGTVENPAHSADGSVYRSRHGEPPVEETITLLTAKARRLARLFESLRPTGHKLDCHQLVNIVEGWQNLGSTSEPLEDDKDTIVPGSPYTVHISKAAGSEASAQTHSCMSTDQGRLLSFIGRGSVLATTDPETTCRLYGQGAEVVFLARARTAA